MNPNFASDIRFDENCFYCTKNDELEVKMKEIAKLKMSTLYLLRDQTIHARCVLAFNSHVTDLSSLNEGERSTFLEDAAQASDAIKATSQADNVNIAIFGDIVSHLHMHLVPKYTNDADWGKAFLHNPEVEKPISEESMDDLISTIRKAINS